MHQKLMLATTTVLLALNTNGGVAGTLSGGEWKATACDAEPVAPAIDMSSRQALNQTNAAMQAYGLAMRSYLNCAIPEANADATAITKRMVEKVDKFEELEAKFVDDANAAQLRFQQGSR